MVFCRRPITRSSSRKRLAIDYWPQLLAIDCLFMALDGMHCPVKLRNSQTVRSRRNRSDRRYI
jgi:hypothetical protein